MNEQKNQRVFRMQPILCPWITSQPYHSSLSKNRAPNQNDPSLTNRFLNNPWINRQMPLGIPRSQDKAIPSIQQSSSQFFYFLRLMQLFPDTHPATLHTVLALCKNDFFCAVDKMLYAKRCKLLCYKKNLMLKNQQNINKNMQNSPNASEAIALNKTCIRSDQGSAQITNNHAEIEILGNSGEKPKTANQIKSHHHNSFCDKSINSLWDVYMVHFEDHPDESSKLSDSSEVNRVNIALSKVIELMKL